MRGALPTEHMSASSGTRSSCAPHRCQPAPDRCSCQTHRTGTRPCCSAQGVLPQATRGASPPVSFTPTTHSHASLSALTRTGAATSGCSGCARLKRSESWRRPLDGLRLLRKQLAGCASSAEVYGTDAEDTVRQMPRNPKSTNSLSTDREVVQLLERCSTHAHGGRM